MKKLLRIGILCALLTTVLCVSVFADDSGINNVESTGATITPATSSWTEAVASGEYYDAERVTVTYNSAVADSQYLLVVLSDNSGTPTASNILYIDQVTAESNTVTFNAYPKSLAARNYVYLASNAETGDGVKALTQVGSFDYKAPYLMGDANGDGAINSRDALIVLQYSVERYDLIKAEYLPIIPQVGDMNGDGAINSRDSLLILRQSVQ